MPYTIVDLLQLTIATDPDGAHATISDALLAMGDRVEQAITANAAERGALLDMRRDLVHERFVLVRADGSTVFFDGDGT